MLMPVTLSHIELSGSQPSRMVTSVLTLHPTAWDYFLALPLMSQVPRVVLLTVPASQFFLLQKRYNKSTCLILDCGKLKQLYSAWHIVSAQYILVLFSIAATFLHPADTLNCLLFSLSILGIHSRTSFFQ